MSLKGKSAIITGGAGGIGRATAMRFVSEGAAVMLTDINSAALDSVADEIKQTGGLVHAIAADVSRADQIQNVVDASYKHFGQVDILVNAAGGSARIIGKKGLFSESDETTWDWTIGVNLKGVLICTKAVIGSMISRHKGKIINIGSIAGVVGIMEMADYSAAKAGVIGFTKALAMEVGIYGIQVNCISPGAISSYSSIDPAFTYVGRGGYPEEVANLIRFLASNESDYITGQNYIIDGGRCLGPKTQ